MAPASGARLVSYNVRFDTADDGKYVWSNRRDAVASTLRFHAPDLLGLQEPLAHQLSDLKARLPGFDWVATSRRAGTGEGEFTPVGYRTDVFSLRASDTFWLSDAPGEPGSVAWDAARPRIATWARLTHEPTGAGLLFVNTHLDHRSARARRRSADLLLDRIPALRRPDGGDPLPVVLAGDFNCTPGEDPHALLAGTGERDSPLDWAQAAADWPHHGPETSRTDFESLLADMQIDHAFVDGVDVRTHGFGTDQVGGPGDLWYPSDHLPLVVEFGLR